MQLFTIWTYFHFIDFHFRVIFLRENLTTVTQTIENYLTIYVLTL